MGAPPFRKVTVPPVAATPAAVTVAVRTTGPPNARLVVEALRVVLVGAGATYNAVAVEADGE
jgi:hypothetical protein